MNYTLGTTVDDVILDRKDYTEYEFTTNAAGGYVLNASSLTSFYWQIEDVENNYETVQHDWVDSATMIPFNLKPNHKYAIRFTPQNMTEEGTLSFTLSKATDNIVNATVNTQYDSDILKAGKTTYYKYDLGDASYNAILDVYEFDQNYVDDVSYEVLGSDMVTPIEMFSSTNGYKFYTEEPTTVYIKVTNTSSSQRVPEFILRKYDRTMTQISGVDSGSNELPINTAQWYEFTAPQNGVYHFDFLSSQHDISVNYEIYFGDELNYSSDYSRYNDYTNWYYYYDEDNNYHEEYGLPNQLDLYYTLLEGEKVYIKVTGDFNANNASTIIPYRWSVSCQEAYPVTDLALDTPTAGATVDGQKQYFKFTAPKSGVYYFWSQTISHMYGDLYENLGGNYLAGGEGYGDYGNFCIEYHLRAGQTVYLCPRQYDNEDVKYEVVVSRTNNSANWTPTFNTTDILSPVAVTEGMEIEANSYSIDSKTAYFMLNADDNASTYIFDISNIDQEEAMAVTFYYSDGSEIVPDEYVTLEGGTTDDDGIFSVEFDPFAFGDEEYIYVKFETSDNNIGDVSILYTYNADENVEEGGDEDEDIDGIPVIGTINDTSWSETSFTTNLSEVYIKVLMADGPNYNLDVLCSSSNSIYVYAASDLETVVASDTLSSTLSRIYDQGYNDESGYVYVKVVSQNGSALGTITCSIEPAPMPMME
ncbi:hypothetical protein [Ruminococcus flavefaciens]|uniref:hypothetical protein n=1 Tax=Ruminococcus flavefaciens TaxID=1265 RepID=UPI0026EFD78D|nr:hypothetical protein [Ruminococcus flavefaciens]